MFSVRGCDAIFDVVGVPLQILNNGPVQTCYLHHLR